MKYCRLFNVTSIYALTAVLLVSGCAGKVAKDQPASVQAAAVLLHVEPGPDPHSFARPDEAAVTHLDLDIAVDFTGRKISGVARLRIDNKGAVDKLYLDTRGLTVTGVTLGEEETKTTSVFGEEVPFLGTPLVVDILPETELVNVYYSTSPDAAALQWLDPVQTAGGEFPFLFTQSQAILARTWLPCQDSPGVRMTYTARVQVPAGLLAVMSAENPTEKTEDGVYTFNMPQPVPSYLMALAVGDIEFRSMGPRTGVYGEASVVEKAAWEFADTEKMMEAAEGLYGPYRWGRYDIIVLPPSFPFGGMENPRLTFATPTVLAGDRSLVALIAHELAHSWSGNLVTNADWDGFWLNEGFTSYFELRIMEEVYGADYERMLALLSKEGLEKEVEEIGAESADTHLHLNLAGRDPDDGMTGIAYDKGSFFLRMIEEAVGREKWDAFLRNYFDEFAFKPMTSGKFAAYLRENLVGDDAALEEALGIDAWIYGPGLPANFPEVRSDELAKVEEQVETWNSGSSAADMDVGSWTTHHWLHFLRTLPRSIEPSRMAELDNAFGLTGSGNSEVLAEWFLLVIANGYEPGYPALEKFLTSVGRRKFLRPLYLELAKTPEGLETARRIYEKARPGYHSVSTGTIDGILGWSE